MTTRTIPTFRADGKRTRDYSLDAIDRLLALGMISCSYSKKGRITAAQFKSDCGANPLVKTAHMGQKYSYSQQLPDGHYAWKHRKLIQVQEAEELMGERVENEKDVDLFIRAVFRAVPLSCLTSTAADVQQNAIQPKQRKVVSIDEFRDRVARPRRVRDNVARPVEFDSEQRNAA